MNKRIKTLLFILSGVLFIAVSAFAYDRLNPEDQPKDEIFDETSSLSETLSETETSTTTTEQSATESIADKAPIQTTTPKVATTTPAQTTTKAPAETANLNRGKVKAPNFTVYDVKGNKVRLSDFLGKPVVVNIWASWCMPCQDELPYFQRMYNELGSNVAFLMVDAVNPPKETKENGQAFISKNGYTFPLYFDMDKSAYNAYQVTKIPVTIFVNKDGYIENRIIGGISQTTLREQISHIYP